MNRYFSLEKAFTNPNGVYFVGIYTLNKDCKGKSASLSDSYQQTMATILQIRKGY